MTNNNTQTNLECVFSGGCIFFSLGSNIEYELQRIVYVQKIIPMYSGNATQPENMT